MSRYQGPRSKHIGGGGYRSGPTPTSSGYRRRSRSPESSVARRKAELDRELDERHGRTGPSRDFQPRSLSKKERQNQRDSQPYAKPEDSSREQDAGPSVPPEGQQASPVKPVSEMSYSSEEGMVTPPQKHVQPHTQSLDVATTSIIPTDLRSPPAASSDSPSREPGQTRSPQNAPAERSITPTRTMGEVRSAQPLENTQRPPIAGFSTIQLRNRLSPTKRSSFTTSTASEGVVTAPISNLLDPRDDEDNAMVGGGRRRGSGSVSRGKGSRSPQKRAFKGDEGRLDRRYEERERDRPSYRGRERDEDHSRDRRYTTGTGTRDNKPHPNHGRGYDRSGPQHPSSDSRSGSRSSRSRSRTPPPRQPPSGPRIRDDGPSSSSRYPSGRRDDAAGRKSGTDEPSSYIPSGPSAGNWASKRGGYGAPVRGRGGYDRIGPGAVAGGREEFVSRGGPIPSGPKFRIPPAEIRSRADVDAEREREREKDRMTAAEAIKSQHEDLPANADATKAAAGSSSRQDRRASQSASHVVDTNMEADRAADSRQSDFQRNPVTTPLGSRAGNPHPTSGTPPPPTTSAPPPPPPPPSGPASWAARRAPSSSVTSLAAGPATSLPSNVTPSPRTPMTPATYASRSPDINAPALPASISGISLVSSTSGRSIAGAPYHSRVSQHQASASPGTPSTPRESGGERDARSGTAQNAMPPPTGPRMESRKPPTPAPINPYSVQPSTPMARPRGESTSSAAQTPASGLHATPSRPSDSAPPQSVMKPQQQTQHRSRGISGWKVKPPPKEVQRVEPKVETAQFEDSKGKVVEFKSRASAKIGKDNWQDWQIELRALQHQRDILTHSFQPLAASFRDIKMKLINNEDYVLATAMKIDAATEIEYDKNMGYMSQ